MFYTKRLMFRALDLERDLNMWVQWNNDEAMAQAISLKPPESMSKAAAKEKLQNVIDKIPEHPLFIICKLPEGEEHPSALSCDDDLFEKDGKARYPAIGMLKIGTVEYGPPAARIRRLGISIDKAHQDQGLGTDAVQWALKYCFTTFGVYKMELETHSKNLRAVHVYEKLGFKIEGRHRERLFLFGERVDLITMGIFEREWREAQST